jgi:predicted ATP-dependent protease
LKVATRPVVVELDVDALRRRQPLKELAFHSTAELPELDQAVGQARAGEAIAFGLSVDSSGYNIFAAGPVGTGKRTAVEAQLRAHARDRRPPDDWVYLHNFGEPRRPLAVALPNGTAGEFAAGMRQFLDDARQELTGAFESETYTRRQAAVTEPLEREQEAALAELRREAQDRGVALELTPAGIATVPLRGTHPMSPAEFSQLPDTVRARYHSNLEELGPSIQSFLNRMRGLQRQGREQLRALEREVAAFAVGHLIEDFKERQDGPPKLLDWLDRLMVDVTDNLTQFQSLGQRPESELPPALRAAIEGVEEAATRYIVNPFVAHESSDAGAPVIVELNPTYPNLFGRIEHRGVLGGGLVTDHTMVRPGALHRANGGYLVLPAPQVLSQPLVWLKLKEVLRAGEIRLENPADQYALFPTTTLTPEPIALDLKIALVGSAALYELAYALDEDFHRLFRVKAEFDWRVPWDAAAAASYARFLGSQARRDGLRHFAPEAVAGVIEYGARLAEDQQNLSTSFAEIAGLAAEASQWAEGDDVVHLRDVERAIERKIYRSSLLEQRLAEMVADGTLMIDFTGERVGQVNGLSVLALGDYSFGRPVRITAAAGPGRGALLSIERETELSGHIHDKGFLTLGGYLRSHYGTDRPIALSASVSFEQAYEHIDGDSASSTELYALLSAIADVPLAQGIAVTGSLNQRGELQAIGGVNEKIEGFHRACRLGGFTGDQGVIIPQANVRNLMLSGDVLDSVRAGRFHVWSARDVDGAIERLTGLAAGARDADGRFPAGSLHARVAQRLSEWAAIAREAGPSDDHRPEQVPAKAGHGPASRP